MKLFLITIMLFSYALTKTIAVSSSYWELLGTSVPINLKTSLEGECSIYIWDKNKWVAHKSSKEEVFEIQANQGFFISSIRGNCKIDMQDANNMPKSRFYSMTSSKQTRLIDNNAKLEWINSAPGCLPLNPGLDMQNARTTIVNHCENTIFSDQSDWRVPSTSEVKDFLMGVSQEGIIPYYKNKGCPRLIGINADKTLSTVNTHNNLPIGKVKPWENLNGGIRCVRNSSI